MFSWFLYTVEVCYDDNIRITPLADDFLLFSIWLANHFSYFPMFFKATRFWFKSQVFSIKALSRALSYNKLSPNIPPTALYRFSLFLCNQILIQNAGTPPLTTSRHVKGTGAVLYNQISFPLPQWAIPSWSAMMITFKFTLLPMFCLSRWMISKIIFCRSDQQSFLTLFHSFKTTTY